MDEDCFVSPVVITVKNDKSVKIALDSRKLNDSCIKRRPHLPIMEELLNQISVEITRDRTLQLFISKLLHITHTDKGTIRRNKFFDYPTMRICKI